MFKYLKSFFEDIKINTYNYLYTNQDTSNKKYPKLLLEDDNDNNYYKQDVSLHIKNYDECNDKQLRIDTLLFIKQYKNTYYKYTNKSKFNQELYNSFLDDNYFDGGLTAYDDDDNSIIFDKYILEYIKNRNDLLTFLQCKNKDIVLKSSLESLENSDKSKKNIDAIFVIDMNDKELFNYCFAIIKDKNNVSIIKSIMFSIIFKYNNEYVRVKLSTFSKNNQNHPYLILESIL